MSRSGVLRSLSRGRFSAGIALVSAASYLLALTPRTAAAQEESPANTVREQPAAVSSETARLVTGPQHVVEPAPSTEAPRTSGSAGRAPHPVARAAVSAEADDVPAAGASAGTMVTPQSISLPSGPATVQGLDASLDVNLSTGVANLAVNIALPHARGDAQPQLAFGYSSGAGRGVAGMGWDIGGIVISRQFVRGMPSYVDPGPDDGWQPGQDRFVFGSDELVPLCVVAGGTCPAVLAGEAMPSWAEGWQYFRPSVERAYLRYFWSPDRQTWRAQARSGVVMEFGQPRVGPMADETAALETNPDHPGRIARWYLSREFDSADAQAPGSGQAPVNIVVYRYLADGASSYLQDVYDTPPAGDDGSASTDAYAHHAHLVYETRPESVDLVRGRMGNAAGAPALTGRRHQRALVVGRGSRNPPPLRIRLRPHQPHFAAHERAGGGPMREFGPDADYRAVGDRPSALAYELSDPSADDVLLQPCDRRERHGYQPAYRLRGLRGLQYNPSNHRGVPSILVRRLPNRARRRQRRQSPGRLGHGPRQVHGLGARRVPQRQWRQHRLRARASDDDGAEHRPERERRHYVLADLFGGRRGAARRRWRRHPRHAAHARVERLHGVLAHRGGRRVSVVRSRHQRASGASAEGRLRALGSRCARHGRQRRRPRGHRPSDRYADRNVPVARPLSRGRSDSSDQPFGPVPIRHRFRSIL